MRLVSLFSSIILATAATSAWAQNAPTVGDATHTVLPKPLKRENPSYPLAAFRNGVEGSVLVEFSVDAYGRVMNPRVVEATPAGVFERDALEAVSKWSYEALGTQTKEMKIRLTFRKRGDAPWMQDSPSSAVARGDRSPTDVGVGEQLPPLAAHPAYR